MGWVAYYIVLVLFFIGSYLVPQGSGSHISPDTVKAITASVTLLTALGQAIGRINLKFYLFWQRLWVWWHSDATAIWRFGVRLDGNFKFLEIESTLKEQAFAVWSPVFTSRRPNELRLKVDTTIHLLISFESAEFAGDGQDHIYIRSEELEVPYGSARSKIDTCITPLISAFVMVFKPQEYSATFDVLYRDKNPFFAFYVAHLNADQVTNFNLVFRPLSISRSGNDKITVTQKGLEIITTSTEGFGELSKAFLLLSSQAVEAIKI